MVQVIRLRREGWPTVADHIAVGASTCFALIGGLAVVQAAALRGATSAERRKRHRRLLLLLVVMSGTTLLVGVAFIRRFG